MRFRLPIDETRIGMSNDKRWSSTCFVNGNNKINVTIDRQFSKFFFCFTLTVIVFYGRWNRVRSDRTRQTSEQSSKLNEKSSFLYSLKTAVRSRRFCSTSLKKTIEIEIEIKTIVSILLFELVNEVEDRTKDRWRRRSTDSYWIRNSVKFLENRSFEREERNDVNRCIRFDPTNTDKENLSHCLHNSLKRSAMEHHFELIRSICVRLKKPVDQLTFSLVDQWLLTVQTLNNVLRIVTKFENLFKKEKKKLGKFVFDRLNFTLSK